VVSLIDQSVAQPGTESTTRIERGRKLYAEHGDEIVETDGVWLVPSQNNHTSRYEVVIGHRGEWCECKDWKYRSPEGGCFHIVAATPICPTCIEYLGRRNPARFLTIEEYDELKQRYPEPIFDYEPPEEIWHEIYGWKASIDRDTLAHQPITGGASS
jgi:hypothetical protein